MMEKERGMAVLGEFPVDEGLHIRIRMGYDEHPCFLVYFNPRADTAFRRSVHAVLDASLHGASLVERMRGTDIDDVEASLQEMRHHSGVICFDEALDEIVSPYVEPDRYLFFSPWRFDERFFRSRLSLFLERCGVA